MTPYTIHHTSQPYLLVAALLFSIGLAVAITKRNAIAVLIGIELMLNAVNLNLVAFNQNDTTLSGQLFALFVMVVAAAESAIALAILLKIYRYYNTINLDEVDVLQEK
jgi:NAD(P)H-quinone oxidoreductase subunit 4L